MTSLRSATSLRCSTAMLDHLLDYLVGGHEQSLWHGEAERLCGPETDDQLELRRLLNRQVGGLLAVEDAIHVTSRAPELFDPIRPVGISFSFFSPPYF